MELSLGNKHPNQSFTSPKGYKGLSGFHKYWGKKPTEAWSFLIENFTQQNDIVLDPFLGSGLIAKECIDKKRKFIGFDINPISIELTNLYLQLPDYQELKDILCDIKNKLAPTVDKLYLLSNGNIATHFLWDDKKITKVWTKKGQKRIEVHIKKREIEQFQNTESYKPIYIRELRLFNNSRINSNQTFSINNLFTPRALYVIDLIRREIGQYDDRTKRALSLILSSSLGQMSKMVFAISNRRKNKEISDEDKIEVGSWVIGYWQPRRHFEINAWNCFENKAYKLLKAIKENAIKCKAHIAHQLSDVINKQKNIYIDVGDSELFLKDIPSNSTKIILTDPPHGDRIPYLELSEMWNSVLNLDSNYEEELVISNAKERNKNVSSYNKKLISIFAECIRILDNNGLLAIMFNARHKSHWNSIYKIEQFSNVKYLGCYPLKYSAGSVVQDNRKGGLKTDFVLVYGKNIKRSHENYLNKKFNTINEWSTIYPKRDL